MFNFEQKNLTKNFKVLKIQTLTTTNNSSIRNIHDRNKVILIGIEIFLKLKYFVFLVSYFALISSIKNIF